MHGMNHRLLLAGMAIAALTACDTRLPTAQRRALPGTPPSVVIDTPANNAQINLGDSILVRTSITAGNGIRTLSLSADALTGDKDLGTFEQTPRYNPITVTLPPGTTDTVIRRYLKVINAGDRTLDTLLIQAIGTDSAGLADTAQIRATIVSGPTVTIDSPVAGDSIPAGVNLAIAVHARDDDGISQIRIHLVGDVSWPTKRDTIIIANFPGTSRDLVYTAIIDIPADAVQRSRIVVSATAIDALSQPGSVVTMPLFIKSTASVAAPRVTQTVPARSERTDTVVVDASGQGITFVGLVIRDSVGTLVSRDSQPVAPVTSNVHRGIAMNLTLAQQGRHLAVTAFAVDQFGRTGYAVRQTTQGSETNLANALVDSTTIVYGQTYTLPLSGTIGDVATDPSRGHIFLSNTSRNRLEVFDNQTRSFDPNGIAVGSFPWGMTQSAFSADTLLVANSGGTNISRVCIGNCGAAGLHEDLAQRLLTRNVYLFNIQESRSGGRIALSVGDAISYSDRPQYIAQSATGRIFYSTRPTTSASNGTIRWLDPAVKYPAPDPQLIY